MTKGKFGLILAAVAVIAFGFSALMQPQSVLLVAGYALLAERDEWLNRQAIQALLLTIGYYLAELVTGWIFGGLATFFGWVRMYGAAGAMSTVDSFVGDVLYLALIAFSVFAVLRVLRGEDAGLPFIAKMASGDFAAAFQKSPEPKPLPVQFQPPAYAAYKETTAAQPFVSSAARPDLQTPVWQKATVGSHCSSCGATLQENSKFCTECGKKN